MTLLALNLRLGLLALPVLLTLPYALRLVGEACATDDLARLNRVLRGTVALPGRCGLLWLGGLSAVVGLG